MVDLNKLKQDMEQDAKAELAVEKLEKNLQQSSADKLQESANLREEASMSNDPDQRQDLLDQSDMANKESIAYKEKANDVSQNPESYKESYLEEIKKEAEKANEPQTNETETPDITADKSKDQEKNKEEEEKSQSPEQEDPTAGDDIKEAFPDDDLFDKIFAEMVGNIADHIQEKTSTPEKEPAQEAER